MNRPIIVIDSGMGGISILNCLKEKLPSENFIYFADTINMPYGSKDTQQLLEIANRNIEHLLSFNPKMFVLACNTLTACCVDDLRNKYSIPIVGCEPAIVPATKLTQKRALVLTTVATANSQRFLSKINKYCCDTLALDELASMIETQVSEDELKNYLISKISTVIDKYDVIVLGCTHYVIIKEMFVDLFSGCHIIDGNSGLTAQVERLLKQNSQLEKYLVGSNVQLIMSCNNNDTFMQYVKYLK